MSIFLFLFFPDEVGKNHSCFLEKQEGGGHPSSNAGLVKERKGKEDKERGRFVLEGRDKSTSFLVFLSFPFLY
jgi:hypothetical protein